MYHNSVLTFPLTLSLALMPSAVALFAGFSCAKVKGMRKICSACEARKGKREEDEKGEEKGEENAKQIFDTENKL